MVAWFSGNVNEVTLCRARLVLNSVIARGYAVLPYTSQSGQLSLLPAAGREISTGQGAITVLYGRVGNRRSDVALAVRHRLCRCVRLSVCPFFISRYYINMAKCPRTLVSYSQKILLKFEGITPDGGSKLLQVQ